MFSLIIAIIAIALVVGLIVASNYFGGSTLSDAQAQAEATRLKAEEMQILGAVDMFNADHARWPANMQELVGSGYLSNVPRGWQVAVGQLPSSPSRLMLLPNAHATGPADGWVLPSNGYPVFQTNTGVPDAVCSKYNLLTRGDDGILKQAFTSLSGQCYGSAGDYRVVINRQSTTHSPLASALMPSQVLEGDLPSASGTVFWDKQPSGEVKVATDPNKTPVAKLILTNSGVYDFGLVQVGQEPVSGARTLINEGNIPVESLAISAPSGFSVANSNCTGSLSAGASCTFAVKFSPSTTGTHQGDVTASASNSGAQVFSISGEGRAASGQVTGIDFGAIAANSNNLKTATLHNTGVGPLTLGAPSVSGAGFALGSYSCSGTLPAGATCSMQVQLTGAGTSAHTGTVSIPTQEAGTLTATLAGQSQAAGLSMASNAASFGNVYVNDTAVSGSYSIANNGNIDLTGLSITAPAGYSITGSNCGSTLAVGASCNYAIAFAPTAAAPYNGSVSVSTANAGSGAVSVSGTGLARFSRATLTSAASISLSGYATTAPVTGQFTYRNDGNQAMTLASPALAAPLSVSNNTCTAVQPGQSCNITAQLSMSSTTGASYQTFVPAGATHAPAAATVNWSVYTVVPEWATTSLNFGTVNVGQSASQGVTLYNRGNVAFDFASYGLNGVPSGFTYNMSACSNVAPNGGSCTVVVTFAPGSQGPFGGGSSIHPSAFTSVSNYLAVSGTGALPAPVFQQTGRTNFNMGRATGQGQYGTGYAVVTNTGATTATGITVTTSAPFSIVGNTCGSTLAPGANCTFSVTVNTAGWAVGQSASVNTYFTTSNGGTLTYPTSITYNP